MKNQLNVVVMAPHYDSSIESIPKQFKNLNEQDLSMFVKKK